MTTQEVFQNLREKGFIPSNFIEKVAKTAGYNPQTVRQVFFGYSGYASEKAKKEIRTALFQQLVEMNLAIARACEDLRLQEVEV